MGKIFNAVILVVIIATPAGAITYTTVDDPLAVNGTDLTGISGNNIVGHYVDASHHTEGFIYNGSTFTPLEPPSAVQTFPLAIDGNNVVGYYDDGSSEHGFLYNGSTYTTIDNPLSPTNGGQYLSGISGNTIVGYYFANPSGPGDVDVQSFIYNGSTFTPYLAPGSLQTVVYGIEGSNIVGAYDLSSFGTVHGFVANGSAITTIDAPLASNFGTYVTGISGSDVIGFYYGLVSNPDFINGFVFNGTSYTPLNDPNAGPQKASDPKGISGLTVVGSYTDASGGIHGFIATNVPEPSSLVSFVLGGLCLAAARRQGRSDRPRANATT